MGARKLCGTSPTAYSSGLGSCATVAGAPMPRMSIESGAVGSTICSSTCATIPRSGRGGCCTWTFLRELEPVIRLLARDKVVLVIDEYGNDMAAILCAAILKGGGERNPFAHIARLRAFAQPRDGGSGHASWQEFLDATAFGCQKLCQQNFLIWPQKEYVTLDGAADLIHDAMMQEREEFLDARSRDQSRGRLLFYEVLIRFCLLRYLVLQECWARLCFCL